MKTSFLTKLKGGIIGTVLTAVFIFIFFSCEIGLGESVDTETPGGAITSPEVDAVIRDTFAIKGSWTDDGNVSSVSITLKNTTTSISSVYYATVKTDGSWYCEIDPENDGLADGSYLATVVISDNGGHKSTLTRSYTIDNTPPLVVLTRPSTKAASASADSYGRTFVLKGQAADDNNISKILVNVYSDSDCSGSPLTSVTLTNVPPTIELDVAEYDYDSDENYKENAYYKIYGEYDADNPETKEFYCTLTAYDDAKTYPLDGNNSSDGNSTSSYYLYSDISTLISSYKVTEIYDMLNGTYTGDSEIVDAVKSKLDEKVINISKFSLNPDNAPTFAVEGCGKLSSGGSLLSSETSELSTSCKVTNDTKSLIVTISPGRDAISIDADNSEKPLYVYLMECDTEGNITGSTEIPLLKAYLNSTGTEWIITEGSGSVEISDSSYVITTDTINTENYAIKLYNSTADGIFYRVCVSAYDEDENEVVESNSRIYAFGLASSASTIETSVSSTPSYISSNSDAADAYKKLYVTLGYTYTDTDMYLYRTIGTNDQEKIAYNSDSSNYIFPLGENLSFTDTVPLESLLQSDGSYASKIVYKMVSVNGETTAASNNKTVSVKYDNTLPILGTPTLPTTSETALSTFSFSGSAEDSLSGLSAVYINITDNEDSSKTTGDLAVSGSDAWTYKISSAALPDGGAFDDEGKKTVKIWAVDNVGLKSEVYTNSSWIYDTSAPEFSLSSYISGDDETAITTNSNGSASFNTGKAFKLTGSASDNFGIQSISVIQSDGTSSITLSTSADLSSTGDSDITYNSEDGSWYIENLPRSFTSPDSLELPSSGSTTSYTYTFTITDSAGNTSDITTVLTVKMDLTAPTVTITSPDSSAFGEDSVSGSAYTFRGTANDDENGLGMQYYKYVIDENEDAPDSSDDSWTKVTYTSSGSWSFSKTLGSGNEGSESGVIYEGKKYIHVIGVDLADNESSPVSLGFMVDQSSPALSVILQTGILNDDSETYTYTDLNTASSYSIKDADVIRFKLTPSDTNGIEAVGGSQTISGSSSSLTLTEEMDSDGNGSGVWYSDIISAEGSYSFVIYADDSSGNGLSGDQTIAARRTSVTSSVIFDKTSPVIDSITVNGSAITSESDNSSVWYGSNTVTVVVNASDAASGLSAVQYSTDNSSWSDMSISSGSYKANVEFADDGSNMLYLRACDELGNISSVFQTMQNDTAADGIVIKIDTSSAEVESLWYTVGSVTSEASGTVYISGITKQDITIYGSISDLQSGIAGLSFTMGDSSVEATEIYYSVTEPTVDESSANTKDWITAAEAASSLEDGSFELLSAFTDTSLIKSWKAVFDKDTVASGKFKLTAENGAGASETLSAFTISVDSTLPKVQNISLVTSSDSYSVYQPVSGTYTYYVNNENQTFTLAGIATDNNGVSKVSLSVEDYSADYSTSGEWTFSGIDLSSVTSTTNAIVTAYDLAGNSYSQTVTIYVDNSAPQALHWADYKNKDIYFRLGSSDNEKTASAASSSGYVNDAGDIWDDNLDKDVGGKYASGTYGNSSTLEIRGYFDEYTDEDGNALSNASGLKMIYYSITSTAPTDSQIAELVENYASLPEYFSPLSEEESRRVIYTSDEAGTKASKEVKSNFNSTISGFDSDKNYLVLLAVDNVGNVSADTLSGYSLADTTATDKSAWNGKDSSGNGLKYYSINVDTVVPEIGDTVYSNKSTESDSSLTGTVYTNLQETSENYISLYGIASDAAAGISSITFTVNGNEITSDSSSYGSLTIEQEGEVTLGGSSQTLSEKNTYWELVINPLAFSGLSSGNVAVYATVTDSAGSGNSKTVSVATVTIDATAPSVKLTIPTDSDSDSDGVQINGTIALSGTVSDGNTLPDDANVTIQYSTDGSSWTSADSDSMENLSVSGNYSYSVSGFDTSVLTDNTTYYLRAAASDIAGNTGYSDSVEVIVSQDSDRPLVTFTNLSIADSSDDVITYMSSSNAVWLKNTTTLMGIVSDDDGIESMSYSTDSGKTWTDLSLNNGSWSLTLSEGLSTVYFKITDDGGKTFTSSASSSSSLTSPKLSDGTYSITSGIPVSLKVDKTSPVTRNISYAYYDETLTSPAYTELSSTLDTVGGKRTKIQLNLDAGDENDIESVTVSISVTDSNDETSTVTYEGQQQTSSAAESDGKYYSNWTVTDIELSELSTGNQYATLTVTDKAGLTKTDTIVISVDNTSSSVSVKSPSSSTTVSGEVSAYGTLTESATLYYSVSPSADIVPGSGDTVSEWTDGDGNTTSMTAVEVDGWTQIEDASLSWTVNFNNADSTASGTNDKTLNKYIIDYGIAAKDSSSSASDAIESSFETIVKLYLHLKSVDGVGNEYSISYPVLVDPQGDRPTVSFSYPAANAVTLGGTVSIYGTASDTLGSTSETIGVDSVWVQLKSTAHRAEEDTSTYGDSPLYDEDSDSITASMTAADLDYMAENGYSVYKMSTYDASATNTAWTSGSSSLASGESAGDYGALASLSGAAWSIEINKTPDSDGVYEFDPPDGTSSNPVVIRVFARDLDGKLSQKADRYVSFDADTPVISDLYLVQSDDEKIASESTASKAYSQDMYVKDSWYLTGTAKDKDKIAILKIGDTKLVENSSVVSAYKDSVTLSDDGTTVSFKYPLATSSGVGALSFTVSATDAATGTSHTGSESISIKYDNTAPEIAVSSNSAFNISSDICQSNSWYTFGSEAYEAAVGNNSQSGFAYTAFYFQRTYTSSGSSVNNIYDVLQAKDSAAVDISGTIATLGSESSTDDNTVVSDSGLYWYRKAISDISGSTFTVSDTKGIRLNALMKIDGALYLITGVSGTSVTVATALPDGVAEGYVAIAGIVDNTTPESAPSSGSIQSDGYYTSPSRDDGDRMIESVDKSGTSWAWEANICSRNIADGPVTLWYVVFDNAGNYTIDSLSGTVSNNRPRIAGAIVKTDYNGDGDVTDDGEEINSYGASKSYSEYYTGISEDGAYIYDPDEKVKNTSAKNPLPTSVTYGEESSPVASLRGRTLIQPEIVGGNGALYYSYSVTNGDTSLTGKNETAFIEEGSTDYTAVTGSINVQTGDLLTFGDTSDSGTGIPFVFTIWDSTEGTAAFTSSQSASLTMYFAIQAASVGSPSASIKPFYWNSSSDNSIYGNSTANGHIELEGDLPSASFTSGSSGEYDLDPKVSGKITVSGTASDTKLINTLTASVFGADYTIAAYSSDTGLLASAYAEDDFASNGFWFELVSQTVDASGHSVSWKLHIDTEKLSSINDSLSSVAGSDLALTVTATNFGIPAASTSNGSLLSIDGSTLYNESLTYTNPASSTPGTSQTASGAETAYYKMDVVPYVAGIKTSLSNLKKSNSSVYDRTALGHYPTSSSDLVYLYGFNLSGGTLSDSATSANSYTLTEVTPGSSYSWYSSSYFTYSQAYEADVSNFTSGNVAVTVNGVKSLNNVNSDDAKGYYEYSGTIGSTGSSTAYANYYNRQPNGDSNNLLTDDLVLDVYTFDSSAAIPISGRVEKPVMGINPVTGMVGFAYVDGPLYFTMGGGYGSGSRSYNDDTSYDFWAGGYDFWTSVAYTYDDFGYSWGTATGGDINSSSASNMQLYTSLWGIGNRAQSGEYSNTNSRRLEQIAQNDSGTYNYNKQRIMSPSIYTTTNGSNTHLFMSYYDDINGEIRFRSGSIANTQTAEVDFGNFVDQQTSSTPQAYNITNCNLLAGNTSDYATGYNAGEYTAVAAVPSSVSGLSDDVAIVIWYDSTNNRLLYTYNETPTTNVRKATYSYNSASTYYNGFSTPVEVFKDSYIGQYCKMTVDKAGGVHIAAYDSSNANVCYAYLPASKFGKASSQSDFTTCVVDSYGIIGTELNIDVAKDTSSSAIYSPYITYYATSCVRPRIAKLVSSSIADGVDTDSDAFTGVWEVSLIPTSSTVPEDHINVGVYKTSDGVLQNTVTSNSHASYSVKSQNGDRSGLNGSSWGYWYANGTSNPIIGYEIKSGTTGTIETAQMQ